MTKKEIAKQQIQIQNEMQSAGFNIVTCGHCGSVLLHRCDKNEHINCLCGRKMAKSDCPDYWHEGAELSIEFDEEIMSKLDQALSLVTFEMAKAMTHGDEIELNDEYTLYHYAEEDKLTVVRTEDWEQLYDVMFNGDDIEFEQLFNDEEL